MKTDVFRLLKDEGQILVLAGESEKASLQVALLDDGSFLWFNPLDIKKGCFPTVPMPVMVSLQFMDELVSAYSQGDLHENCAKLQELLNGCVAEYNEENDYWEYYRCDVAVMPCCVGEYLRIVSRKEL